VVVGDFNARPDTDSLRLLEAKGLKNLIVQHGVKTTRTHLFEYGHIEPQADYIFISSDICLREFRVMPDIVSDHVPLYAEID
jgi:endonuclease/exonuclease/phosphatase family metal-dependent hydrolase